MIIALATTTAGPVLSSFSRTRDRRGHDGVDVFLLSATRGQSGRYRRHWTGDDQHPGPSALAMIREQELRRAASVLGVRDVRDPEKLRAAFAYHPSYYHWKERATNCAS